MSECGGDEIDKGSTETNNPKHDEKSEPLLAIAGISLTESLVSHRKRGCDQSHADGSRCEEIKKAEISFSQ